MPLTSSHNRNAEKKFIPGINYAVSVTSIHEIVIEFALSRIYKQKSVSLQLNSRLH